MGIFYEFLIVESIFLDLFNQNDPDPTAPADATEPTWLGRSTAGRGRTLPHVHALRPPPSRLHSGRVHRRVAPPSAAASPEHSCPAACSRRVSLIAAASPRTRAPHRRRVTDLRRRSSSARRTTVAPSSRPGKHTQHLSFARRRPLVADELGFYSIRKPSSSALIRRRRPASVVSTDSPCRGEANGTSAARCRGRSRRRSSCGWRRSRTRRRARFGRAGSGLTRVRFVRSSPFEPELIQLEPISLGCTCLNPNSTY